MSRTVYTRDPETGEVIKTPADEHYAKKHAARNQRDGNLPLPGHMDDIKEFVSPITGEVISSRSTIREHEKTHGVRQCGELKHVSDFDNSGPLLEGDKDMEAAFGKAVEKTGI